MPPKDDVKPEDMHPDDRRFHEQMQGAELKEAARLAEEARKREEEERRRAVIDRGTHDSE